MTRYFTITLILFVVFTSAFAFGDRLILTSHGGGKYDYSYSAETGVANWSWGHPDILLAGLSGVTGATTSGLLATCFPSASFTASSVTLTLPIRGEHCGIHDGRIFGTLEISSLARLGYVDYLIETDLGIQFGTVAGPAGPIPEPSSLLLLGSGVLGLAGVIRWRLSL